MHQHRIQKPGVEIFCLVVDKNPVKNLPYTFFSYKTSDKEAVVALAIRANYYGDRFEGFGFPDSGLPYPMLPIFVSPVKVIDSQLQDFKVKKFTKRIRNAKLI